MVKVWQVILGIVGIFVLGVFWARYFGGFTSKINASEIMTFLGAVVTAFSFAAGCYFGLLAINAFAHVREIERVAREAREMNQAIKERESDAIDKSKVFVEYLTESANLIAEALVDLGAKGTNPDGYITRTYRLKAEYAFRFSTSADEKMNHARSLVQFGAREDLEMVRGYLQKTNHPDCEGLLREVQLKLSQSTKATVVMSDIGGGQPSPVGPLGKEGRLVKRT
jgi:hypothetical protein